MCNLCFSENIETFETWLDFEKFDILLSKKLTQTLTLVTICDNYKSIDFRIYKCNECNEHWCLSEPENAWRGFFCSQRNVTEIIDNKFLSSKIKMSAGCLLIFVFAIVILILLNYN